MDDIALFLFLNTSLIAAASLLYTTNERYQVLLHRVEKTGLAVGVDIHDERWPTDRFFRARAILKHIRRQALRESNAAKDNIHLL